MLSLWLLESNLIMMCLTFLSCSSLVIGWVSWFIDYSFPNIWKFFSYLCIQIFFLPAPPHLLFNYVFTNTSCPTAHGAMVFSFQFLGSCYFGQFYYSIFKFPNHSFFSKIFSFLIFFSKHAINYIQCTFHLRHCIFPSACSTLFKCIEYSYKYFDRLAY